MLSCKETVRILTVQEKLTLWQKIELRAHLFVCKHCHSYAEHLKAISKQLQKSYLELTRVEATRLKALEEKIIHRLKGFDDEIF